MASRPVNSIVGAISLVRWVQSDRSGGAWSFAIGARR
jgi:hypothetical protein